MTFIEQEAAKVTGALQEDLKSIRAGRASPGLVENISVDAYGGNMPLKNVAAITVPDARTILIEPWDAAVIKKIEEAIGRSSLGLSPVVEQKHIRLNLPPLTQERRKELARVISENLEAARIKLRKLREEERERITAKERTKEISQDEKFRGFKKLDEIIAQWQRKAEEFGKRKEEEIMNI